MTNPEPQNTPSRKLRRWTWFVVGFVVVFVGMMFLRMEYYDGQVVQATKLWHYYLLEVRQAWNSTGNLGPKSGSSAHALYVAMQHVLCAAAGGTLLVGFQWILQKRSHKLGK